MEAILLNNRLRILHSKLGLDGSPRVIPSHYSDIEIDSDGRIFIAACRGFGYTYHYDCAPKLVNGKTEFSYWFTKRRAGSGEVVCTSETIEGSNLERKMASITTIGRYFENTPYELGGRDQYEPPNDLVNPTTLYNIDGNNPWDEDNVDWNNNSYAIRSDNFVNRDLNISRSSELMVYANGYLYYLNKNLDIIVLDSENLSFLRCIPIWRKVVDEAANYPSNLQSDYLTGEHCSQMSRIIFPKALVVSNKTTVSVIFSVKENRRILTEAPLDHRFEMSRYPLNQLPDDDGWYYFQNGPFDHGWSIFQKDQDISFKNEYHNGWSYSRVRYCGPTYVHSAEYFGEVCSPQDTMYHSLVVVSIGDGSSSARRISPLVFMSQWNHGDSAASGRSYTCPLRVIYHKDDELYWAYSGETYPRSAYHRYAYWYNHYYYITSWGLHYSYRQLGCDFLWYEDPQNMEVTDGEYFRGWMNDDNFSIDNWRERTRISREQMELFSTGSWGNQNFQSLTGVGILHKTNLITGETELISHKEEDSNEESNVGKSLCFLPGEPLVFKNDEESGTSTRHRSYDSRYTSNIGDFNLFVYNLFSRGGINKWSMVYGNSYYANSLYYDERNPFHEQMGWVKLDAAWYYRWEHLNELLFDQTRNGLPIDVFHRLHTHYDCSFAEKYGDYNMVFAKCSYGGVPQSAQMVIRGFGELDEVGLIFDGSMSNVVFHKEDDPQNYLHRMPAEIGMVSKTRMTGCMCSDVHYKIKYEKESLANFYRHKLCLLVGESISDLSPIQSIFLVSDVNLFHMPISQEQKTKIDDLYQFLSSKSINGISLNGMLLSNSARHPSISVMLNSTILNRHNFTYTDEVINFPGTYSDVELPSSEESYPRSLRTIVLLDSIANEFTDEQIASINTECKPQITAAHINYRCIIDSPYLDGFSHFMEQYPRQHKQCKTVPPLSSSSDNSPPYLDRRIHYYNPETLVNFHYYRYAMTGKAMYTDTSNIFTGIEDFHTNMITPDKFGLVSKKMYHQKIRVFNINPLILVCAENEDDLILGTINRNYWSENIDKEENKHNSFKFFENFYGRQLCLHGGKRTFVYIEGKDENRLYLRIFGRSLLATKSYLEDSPAGSYAFSTDMPQTGIISYLDGSIESSYTNRGMVHPTGAYSGINHDGINTAYVDLEKYRRRPTTYHPIFGAKYEYFDEMMWLDGLVWVEVSDTTLFEVGKAVKIEELELQDASGMSLLKHDVFTGFSQTGVNSSYLEENGISEDIITPMNTSMIAPTPVDKLETVSTVIEECDYLAGTFQRLSGGGALIFVGVKIDDSNLSDIWCYYTQDGDEYIKSGKLLSEVPIQKIGVRQIHGRFTLTYFDSENILHLAHFDHSFSPIESEEEVYKTELALITQDKYNTEINYIEDE